MPRPPGAVRLALLAALAELWTAERGPCLRELAARACVSRVAARATLANLVRAGVVRVVRLRRAPWRNRPVAEYEPGGQAPGDGPAAVDAVLRSWTR